MADALPDVHLIATGGSISCIGRSRLDYIDYSDDDRRLPIADMLARIPETSEFANVSTEQLSNAFGGSLGPSVWLTLARRVNEVWSSQPKVAGIAVTHGTSTLEETAYFLHLTSRSEKPVVITGAMRPPSALSTDADLNLVDCIRVAADPQAAGKGALVVLNSEIHSARDVTKTHTARPNAFRSSDFGCLGYADTDKTVVFYRAPLHAHTSRSEFDVSGLSELPRVEILMAYAGADGMLVDYLADGRCDGLVVAGLGSGNVPGGFRAALKRAQQRGIPVVLASQVGSGRTRHSERNRAENFISPDNLTPKKARILLMLALTKTRDPGAIARMMRTY